MFLLRNVYDRQTLQRTLETAFIVVDKSIFRIRNGATKDKNPSEQNTTVGRYFAGGFCL